MPSSLEPLPYLSPEAASAKSSSRTPFWSFPNFRYHENDPNLNHLFVSKEQQHNITNSRRWLILIYTFAVLSIWTARCCTSSIDAADSALGDRFDVLVTQRDHLQQDIIILEDYIRTERNKYMDLKRTKRALKHELEMFREYREETGRTNFQQHQDTIQKWLATRHSTLVHRIRHLQRYLQRMSYTSVIRKFGRYDNYRVELIVALQTPTKIEEQRKLIIETVPLISMPASIHLFLDTISAGNIWDNAMFVHHESNDHVLPAAPVDYESHTVRRNALGSLGWNDLGFPEYNDHYPHEMYTVGFAAKGPTFYINTQDNTEDHGPGGQSHHLLPEDAEPCFGKVISGQDVVDDMIRWGDIQTKMEPSADHPWADEEHRATRIVSARVLPNTWCNFSTLSSITNYSSLAVGKTVRSELGIGDGVVVLGANEGRPVGLEVSLEVVGELVADALLGVPLGMSLGGLVDVPVGETVRSERRSGDGAAVVGANEGGPVGLGLVGLVVGDTLGETLGAPVGKVVGDIVGDFDGDCDGDREGESVGALEGDFVGDTVGDLVGVRLGALLGDFVGDLVGETVGDLVGDTEGDTVGVLVGELVGEDVGAFVGDTVGAFVGDTVGAFVGDTVGAFVGDTVGAFVGDKLGAVVGDKLGAFVGDKLGAFVGDCVGDRVGLVDGDTVGDAVGDLEGRNVGRPVGPSVGCAVGIIVVGAMVMIISDPMVGDLVGSGALVGASVGGFGADIDMGGVVGGMIHPRDSVGF